MAIFGTGLKAHLAATETVFPEFQARPPWFGGDLQTLRNSVITYKTSTIASRRLMVPIDVGALSVSVDQPVSDTVPSKAILLVHGLGGDEDSSYMLMSRDYFLRQGFQVYRMNYRGVSTGRGHAPVPYSAGLTSDVRAVIRAIAKDFEAPNSLIDLYLMGFSLGGQLVLRTLGEGDIAPWVKGAVTVSAPLDLSSCQRWLSRPRNRAYLKYVVSGMQRDLEGVEHPKVTLQPNQLKSVWAFDEHIIAPYFGFRDAEDYYSKVSCGPLLSEIETPVLAIHAENDSWIPVADYQSAAWPSNVAAGAIVTESGGHVGFHAKGSQMPWYLDTASLFFSIV